MAFLNLPLVEVREYDVLQSDGLVRHRRARFPLATARRRYRLTYGPTTFSDAQTVRTAWHNAKGAASVVLSIGTGRYGTTIRMRYDSPSAVYVEVDFILDQEYS